MKNFLNRKKSRKKSRTVPARVTSRIKSGPDFLQEYNDLKNIAVRRS